MLPVQYLRRKHGAMSLLKSIYHLYFSYKITVATIVTAAVAKPLRNIFTSCMTTYLSVTG